MEEWRGGSPPITVQVKSSHVMLCQLTTGERIKGESKAVQCSAVQSSDSDSDGHQVLYTS